MYLGFDNMKNHAKDCICFPCIKRRSKEIEKDLLKTFENKEQAEEYYLSNEFRDKLTRSEKE